MSEYNKVTKKENLTSNIQIEQFENEMKFLIYNFFEETINKTSRNNVTSLDIGLDTLIKQANDLLVRYKISIISKHEDK
jgi:hypothetical protein